MVWTILEMLVPGCFAVKSLEAVQAEVLLVVMLTITTSEQSTQVLDHGLVLLLIIGYQEEIGHSPSTFVLSENVELFSP